jgi:hypothetical protein
LAYGDLARVRRGPAAGGRRLRRLALQWQGGAAPSGIAFLAFDLDDQRVVLHLDPDDGRHHVDVHHNAALDDHDQGPQDEVILGHYLDQSGDHDHPGPGTDHNHDTGAARHHNHTATAAHHHDHNHPGLHPHLLPADNNYNDGAVAP